MSSVDVRGEREVWPSPWHPPEPSRFMGTDEEPSLKCLFGFR